jgi:hypothetical protein
MTSEIKMITKTGHQIDWSDWSQKPQDLEINLRKP